MVRIFFTFLNLKHGCRNAPRVMKLKQGTLSALYVSYREIRTKQIEKQLHKACIWSRPFWMSYKFIATEFISWMVLSEINAIHRDQIHYHQAKTTGNTHKIHLSVSRGLKLYITMSCYCIISDDSFLLKRILSFN